MGRKYAVMNRNSMLGIYESQFMVVCNKAECDEHYASTDKEWIGRASMSKHHRFLIRRDLHWQYFNGLVFGLVEATLEQAIKETEAMLIAAQTFTKNAANTLGWSTNIGY